MVSFGFPFHCTAFTLVLPSLSPGYGQFPALDATAAPAYGNVEQYSSAASVDATGAYSASLYSTGDNYAAYNTGTSQYEQVNYEATYGQASYDQYTSDAAYAAHSQGYTGQYDADSQAGQVGQYVHAQYVTPSQYGVSDVAGQQYNSSVQYEAPSDNQFPAPAAPPQYQSANQLATAMQFPPPATYGGGGVSYPPPPVIAGETYPGYGYSSADNYTQYGSTAAAGGMQPSSGLVAQGVMGRVAAADYSAQPVVSAAAADYAQQLNIAADFPQQESNFMPFGQPPPNPVSLPYSAGNPNSQWQANVPSTISWSNSTSSGLPFNPAIMNTSSFGQSSFCPSDSGIRGRTGAWLGQSGSVTSTVGSRSQQGALGVGGSRVDCSLGRGSFNENRGAGLSSIVDPGGLGRGAFGDRNSAGKFGERNSNSLLNFPSVENCNSGFGRGSGVLSNLGRGGGVGKSGSGGGFLDNIRCSSGSNNSNRGRGSFGSNRSSTNFFGGNQPNQASLGTDGHRAELAASQSGIGLFDGGGGGGGGGGRRQGPFNDSKFGGRGSFPGRGFGRETLDRQSQDKFRQSDGLLNTGPRGGDMSMDSGLGRGFVKTGSDGGGFHGSNNRERNMAHNTGTFVSSVRGRQTDGRGAFNGSSYGSDGFGSNRTGKGISDISSFGRGTRGGRFGGESARGVFPGNNRLGANMAATSNSPSSGGRKTEGRAFGSSDRGRYRPREVMRTEQRNRKSSASEACSDHSDRKDGFKGKGKALLPVATDSLVTLDLIGDRRPPFARRSNCAKSPAKTSDSLRKSEHDANSDSGNLKSAIEKQAEIAQKCAAVFKGASTPMPDVFAKSICAEKDSKLLGESGIKNEATDVAGESSKDASVAETDKETTESAVTAADDKVKDVSELLQEILMSSSSEVGVSMPIMYFVYF